VLGAESVRNNTKPANHLTESELLGLMEQHQIGTDASMATHVSNVQKRAYVELDENTRQMVPSALGLA
jgi:DNA topoisomerase-3